MAYVPPHKRNLKGKGCVSPTPVPDSLVTYSRKRVNFREKNHRMHKGDKIMYAEDWIYKWFAVGLEENENFPPYIRLKPITLETVQFLARERETPLLLVNDDLAKALDSSFEHRPWEVIADKVLESLPSSYEVVRNRMKEEGLEKILPVLDARFGKLVFYDSSLNVSADDSPLEEAALRRMRKSLHTSLPSSYIEEILNEVVHKIGLVFLEEKDIYHVKLSDKKRADSMLCCKCRFDEDKKLQFYKVEINKVRQFFADVSCLNKNLDLRLLLYSERIVTSLTDDETKNISDLIRTAVLDSDVNGGLRWPMGKTSSDQRYNVVGGWHTTTKTYKCSSLKLKTRQADRIDFRTGVGTTSNEARLKLKALNSKLQEENFNEQSVRNELKENLRLIWENFLCCERFLL